MRRVLLIISIVNAFATLMHSAHASVDTNSSAGINSAILDLNGDGVYIGQVEPLRPGKPEFDDASNSNFGTKPVAVYLLDDREMPTGANGNGNGIVDTADYTVWRDRFEAAGSGGVATVPEPICCVLAAMGITDAAVVGRNRQRYGV